MKGMRSSWFKRLRVSEGVVLCVLALAVPLGLGVPLAYTATEAPAGFDDLTNGFTTQATFDLDRDVFDEFEVIDDGLGPVYNAQACRECHQNPVSGANAQFTELRAGHLSGSTFVNAPGGSLINDRAIDARIQERVPGTEDIVVDRAALNTLGDGFVEAIADSTFTTIRNSQPSGMKGEIVIVPIAESPGFTRVGRFGWKDQHGSLLSFSADAYVNEMGITSPLQPNENTSMGNSVAAFDGVADPEEAPTPANPFGPDVEFFARFMRATKAPPRDTVVAATADSIAGSNIFNSIGCQHCHRTSITTAPNGTVFNGSGAGKFAIGPFLGDKIIHPYSDFLMHDVGTGDGILQNGPATTRNKMRTMVLWGVRTRSRLMHDNFNVHRNTAILRHTNEAEPVIQNYIFLSTTQKNQLITFLSSL